MLSSKELDKYYTKSDIARHCYELFKPFIDADTIIIEPSAGSGAFLKVSDNNIIGFDIAPEGSDIIECDYLNTNVRDFISAGDKSLACIGNPPFGTKASLAIKFTNKALKEFGLVGFILPLQFRKWSVQKHIDKNAFLILDKELPEDSFELDGKTYKVRCSFQIWSMSKLGQEDIRIKTKPETNHPDFEMWQFNRTQEAEKFFDYDWDFAVPRQGYQDYSFRAMTRDQCHDHDPTRKKQWIFFKATSPDVLNKLLKLDFETLSKKNTGIPGFGKADVIIEYNK